MSKFIESGRTKLIVEPFTLTWWKTKLIRLIVVVAIPYNTINLVSSTFIYSTIYFPVYFTSHDESFILLSFISPLFITFILFLAI